MAPKTRNSSKALPMAAKKNSSKDAEIARLKQELAITKATTKMVKKAKKKSKDMSDEERVWRHRFLKATKTYIWGASIFCTNTKRLFAATKFIMVKLNLKEFEHIKDKKMRQEAEAEFIAQNADLVRDAWNEIRNYAQSQLRQLYVDRVKAGEWNPTTEQIKMCILRDEEFLMTKEGHKVFDYYWDVLLMKVAGKQHWEKDIRHFTTISKAVNHYKAPAICPGMEAFVYLLFLNCEPKWKEIAADKMAGKKHDPKDKRWVCQYTTSKAGQNEWGGWTPQARELFRKLRDEVKEARDEDHVEEVEELALKRIRMANGYDKEGEEATKKKPSNKRKTVDVDSDDEDPFAEEDEEDEDDEEEEED